MSPDSMILSLSLTFDSDKSGQRRGSRHEIEIEDESGHRKNVPVFFVARSSLPDMIGEVQDGKIFLCLGLSPVLVPIIGQMLYFRSLGAEEEPARTAALLYAARVLRSDDFLKLSTLLGFHSTGLVAAGSFEGDPEFYAAAMSRLLTSYEANVYVARSRALASMGIEDSTLEAGYGGLIAFAIMKEGPILRKDKPGRKSFSDGTVAGTCESIPESQVVHPALREQLPEIIALLTELKTELEHAFDSQQVKRTVSPLVEIEVKDPLLSRVLYLFEATERRSTDEPSVFAVPQSDNIRFKKTATARIDSVIKNLLVDTNREFVATKALLAGAERKYAGVLGSGATFAGLLGRAKDDSLTPEDVARVKHVINDLSARRTELRDMLAGRKRATV